MVVDMEHDAPMLGSTTDVERFEVHLLDWDKVAKELEEQKCEELVFLPTNGWSCPELVVLRF